MTERERLCAAQQELSERIGLPGREEPIREYLRSALEPWVDRMHTDGAGNLIAERSGKEGGRRILLDAHMDEVGFMVNHIDRDGFLRIAALGAVDTLLLTGTPLQFLNREGVRVYGICTSIPPHLAGTRGGREAPAMEDLTVDVGASSAEEVMEMGLEVGSVGTFDVPFRRLNEESVLGKAFDDRSGCNVLLQTARRFSEEQPQNTLLFSFSVGEETAGHYGAQVTARNETADIALVIENTTATDTPGVPEHKIISRCGRGPALTIADKSHIVPQDLLERLKRSAEDEGIRWQYKKPIYGGTNAGDLSRMGRGVPTGVISVPGRYIHGPAALVRLSDLEQTVRLICRIGSEKL